MITKKGDQRAVWAASEPNFSWRHTGHALCGQMKILDKILCGILGLGTAGHMVGTFKYTEFGSGLFVWSMAGVLAAALLTALNFVRQARADDKTIAAIALCGNLAWAGVCVLFGLSIKNVLDPRAMMHIVTALLLALMSVRTLRV